ncbi:response regulator transcription factor [Catenulispora yoronensis]|uniref:response regulator transcription factor n=1 Tax=Catenulispora yoronensis TaxID=450799 RepID=UPI0031E144B1
MTVVIADDHALFREGLREILEAHDDMTVVGEAATGDEAVAQAVRHRPDIVLLDVEMPGPEAADTVTAIRRASPATGVIILSMYDGPEVLRQLIGAGSRGYLLKSVNRVELVAALRSVVADDDRIVLAVSREGLSRMQQPASQDPLSVRELELLHLVAAALSNSQIATRMDITVPTVKRHLRNIFMKLGAVSRMDAVNRAVDNGLLPGRQSHGAS